MVYFPYFVKCLIFQNLATNFEFALRSRLFSLDCSINKLKVGVGDIPIIHNSPGLRSVTVDWKQGQKYFLEKYNKYANKTLTV